MPLVVTKDNFSVNPTPVATPRLNSPLSFGAAGIPGQQLQAEGQAYQKLGVQQTAVALDALDEANRLRTDDAINRLKEFALRKQFDPEDGYERLKGYDALNRPDGKPLADEYGDMAQQEADRLAGELGNDAQREMFAAASRDIIAGFKNQAIQYEGRQFQEYALSVREGTIKNRIQEVALNFDKPDVINEALGSIRAASFDLARQTGKSAEWAEAKARESTSAAHMVVLETALQKGNPEYADNYFKAHSKEMEPEAILRANAVLSGELDQKLATGIAGRVMQGEMNNIATPDSERAFNIAVGAESGWKHFGGAGSVAGPDEPTTSPKGAIGLAQVMPDTAPEAAKLAGLDWDEERYRKDPAYNYAIGKAYFDRQLKDFGSVAQAYAAYNAGPGATRIAIKAAKSGIDGKTWLDYLPQETQDYVARNMDKLAAGSGQNARPTLLDLQNKVRAEIGDGNQKRLKLALDEVERQYDTVTKAIAQREDEATASAMREVLANGGDYTALPALMRANIPVKDVGSVMDFAKKIAKGDDSTNLQLYNRYTANPQELAALTDDQFFRLRKEFSETDFKHFSDERAKILNGTLPEADNPGSLNSAAIKSVLNDRLLMLGLDPTPKDDDKNAPRIGAIRKFVNDSIAAAQRSEGKKFNDAETSQFIDNLFARQTVVPAGWLGDRKQISTMSITAKQIPPAVKSALEQAFKKQGVQPTDQDLLNAYWAHSLRNTKGTF